MYNKGHNIRAHPVMIFMNIRRFLWLWIMPIFRALFSILRGNFSLWTKGLWLDLSVVSLIFLFSTLRWWRCTYSYDENFITQIDGLFFSKVTTLKWERISVLKVIQPLYLRPLGAMIIHADTIGGSYRNSDINIMLSKKRVKELAAFSTEMGTTSCKAKSFTPKASSILGFSLVSTNYFVSFLYIATFVSQAGRLSNMFISFFENLTQTFSSYIPPAAAAIAYLLIIMWVIGILFTILRYYKFSVTRKDQLLFLSGGFLSKQTFFINVNELNYLDLRQNIITYFFRVCSVFISSVGVDKERADLNCIVPAQSKKTFRDTVNYLLPELSHSAPYKLRPVPFGFMRFLFDPIIYTLVIITLLTISRFLVPSWAVFIQFVSYVILLPCVGLFIIRIAEYRSSGIGIKNGIYTMSYSKGFSLHTLHIPKDKVVKVHINQSWIQYADGNCDVHIYTVSEGRRKHKCRNLKKSDAVEFFGINNITAPYNTLGNILFKIYKFFGLIRAID